MWSAHIAFIRDAFGKLSPIVGYAYLIIASFNYCK